MISGIYQIKNLKNNKIYIGSSKNIKERFLQHKYNLKNNKHCNPILQNSWNKYGEENFEFIIIEIINNTLLIEK
jgi:group I intron endonuclease